jgi:NAD(P)-dependent dehydrogenase (short-subunit alcohol dehydrogenase family)
LLQRVFLSRIVIAQQEQCLADCNAVALARHGAQVVLCTCRTAGLFVLTASITACLAQSSVCAAFALRHVELLVTCGTLLTTPRGAMRKAAHTLDRTKHHVIDVVACDAFTSR